MQPVCWCSGIIAPSDGADPSSNLGQTLLLPVLFIVQMTPAHSHVLVGRPNVDVPSRLLFQGGGWGLSHCCQSLRKTCRRAIAALQAQRAQEQDIVSMRNQVQQLPHGLLAPAAIQARHPYDLGVTRHPADDALQVCKKLALIHGNDFSLDKIARVGKGCQAACVMLADVHACVGAIAVCPQRVRAASVQVGHDDHNPALQDQLALNLGDEGGRFCGEHAAHDQAQKPHHAFFGRGQKHGNAITRTGRNGIMPPSIKAGRPNHTALNHPSQR